MVLSSLSRLFCAPGGRDAGSAPATGWPAATPLSRVTLLGLALCTPACLITDPPQFKPPKHTAPFLVESSADPDPRRVKVVNSATLKADQTITFSADVVSQDDTDLASPFHQVESRLYIDYGFKDAPGQASRFVLNGSSLVNPGSLDQTSGRRVSASWIPDVYRVEPGCHTATLVVSHRFDPESGCWACTDDFSTITWQILRCDSSAGDCDALDLTGCENLTNSCAVLRASTDAGLSCPETADGGTQ
jgi:hypothetical protein